MSNSDPVDSCTLCGTPLDGTYCAQCSADRASAEPFVLALPDDDEPPTERKPAPDLAKIRDALLTHGAPAALVDRALAAATREMANKQMVETTCDAMRSAGLPMVDEQHKRSGVSFGRGAVYGRLQIAWVSYARDDRYPLADVQAFMSSACEIAEACGYAVSRLTPRSLIADVYEPIVRGAA